MFGTGLNKRQFVANTLQQTIHN